MKVIEFLGGTPIENVLAVLNFKPDEVVYMGYMNYSDFESMSPY